MAGEDPKDVVEDLEKHLSTSKNLEHLPISSLKDDITVMDLLNLSYAEQHESLLRLPNDMRHSPTSLLRKFLRFASSRTEFSESYIRCALNLILVSCIAQEKRVILKEREKDLLQSQAFHSSLENQPQTPEPPKPLSLKYETELSFQVTDHGTKKLLVGKADYSLWYDATETMGANLVVVEAKAKFYAGSAVPQLIAYMGIVHRIRKLNRKQNSAVYGIASDSLEFRFYFINNESKLHKSRVYFWETDATDIVSFIRLIVRAAVNQSPTTTPYSGEKKNSQLSALAATGGGSSSFDLVVLEGDFEIFPEGARDDFIVYG
ncbi:hypothetical protein AJ79_09240 [Helicocarpus griseus UAMH5409]|uniref:Fungal-type protein kinase domain-containing protein n=1 Tax=Helicocarpus griseus UAMH5409 TaxID=1447875 RepID=A0A2B7WLI3_9EURO|nr:hypothetical protein AJ79_09240 [Helicocarpus griseus UAMH5409]